MRCPFCGFAESKVIDSRPADDGESIRRRRECMSCEKRFTTFEKIESIPVMVVKKDGTREIFSREKLERGLIRACEKSTVSMAQIEYLVNSIEQVVYNSLKREISTNDIGELVMERLKDLDQVAYVRFASVYRNFKDINTFMDELNRLLTEK